MSCVTLKAGREKSLQRRHPWIFSGALQEMLQCQIGEILPIYAADGKMVGHAMCHPQNSIAGRMISFGPEEPLQALVRHLRQAKELRSSLKTTNGYRLINAEGDFLPGLIVDCYDDVLVIQINTAGMERLKAFILGHLIDLMRPRSIYEKSISSARRQEGLPDREGTIWGEEISQVSIIENEIPFAIDLEQGQKTGFFLDQREMRKKIRELSLGKRVLNCFAYTGGFSKAALWGGAKSVTSVEISKEACALCVRNIGSDPKHVMVQADVFDYLRQDGLNFDIVILDPPAFAKKRSDIDTACSGYKEINRVVMSKIAPSSLVLTSSCSGYIDAALFQDIIAQAAAEASREVRILSRHEQALDHPISLFHPEGDYLKSLLLQVT